MENQFSIKETKEAITLMGAMTKSFDAAYADGKFELAELALLIPVAGYVQPAVDGAGVIPKELGELNDDEQKELHQHIDDTFGAGSFEKVGEQILLGVAHFFGAWSAIKAMKVEPATAA